MNDYDLELKVKVLQEQVKALFVTIEQQTKLIEHLVATMTALTNRVVDGK